MKTNVLDYLEKTARRAPRATAFADAQRSITWGELREQARRIGTAIAARIPMQQPVLFCLDKSPQAVAVMMGIAYAGCFYVPTDPAMPAARLERILHVLSPALLVTDEAHAGQLEPLAEAAGIPLLFTEELLQEPVNAALLAKRRSLAIDTDLLYVLFTSGSTGVPKGVAIPHRAVIDLAEWVCHALPVDENTRFGNQAPLYFDNSVLEIYSAMRQGGMVYFLPGACFSFPKRMRETLIKERINTLFWVPTALTAFAASGLLSPELPLKNVFFCGEVMPCKTLNLWRQALPAALYVNLYGPTEITDVCTCYIVDRDYADNDSLPIGRPCANSRVILLDGELCVTGTCLSPGYYNDPERTAAAFRQNPLRPAVRELLYHTGDLAEYNDRGELMFLGRADGQVKRRGCRIELGEIEASLTACPGVTEGCAVFDAEKAEITCFYAGSVEPRALLSSLKQLLPRYMLPDRLQPLEALPRTANGKLDRLALKERLKCH